MKIKERAIRSLATLAACGAFAVGVMAVAESPAEAKRPCICLDVYDPVTCDGGVIFPNACYAKCAGATGCVPGIVE